MEVDEVHQPSTPHGPLGLLCQFVDLMCVSVGANQGQLLDARSDSVETDVSQDVCVCDGNLPVPALDPGQVRALET